MKSVNNYILLVDSNKGNFSGNNAGRYRVGAKSEKEAIKFLRGKIKFGSIQVYYKCSDVILSYKEIVKES